MSELSLPIYQYDVLLERLRSDPDGDVRQHVLDLTHEPGREAMEKGWALSTLLPNIIRHEMYELLLLLLRRGATVGGQAVKLAAGRPSTATYYLDTLFAHGWDINHALASSFALHNPSLTGWLLEMGADPNASCDTEYTPLSIAVRQEPLETIQFLLEHAKDSESGHLVYCATEREPESESIRIIRFLHQHWKPIDDMFWQDKRSFRNRGRILRGTPLHNACELYNFETVLALLELGADIDGACVRDNVGVGPSPREVIETKLRELSASREDAVGRGAASWQIADRKRTAWYAPALERALLKPRMARIPKQHQQRDEAADTAVRT
ncbi:hypothetical protein LTR35_006845 [Friedmanniomyces endolithicus]|uniref:Ankyrin repeat domain-containing protein n=1 Tax=Friedmanniomyces endolithicus TaxID=329885 RepID=A0AAN6G1F7_9PEZI|nr:hypothetical protein LTR35_006845 [Friedmanniomyces endolithicus]KAK0296011.1 hypothetical protein LTS00_005296 [Friedmanniomyces endolithicus]KAK0328016.1 hypothetical protein LTR82_001535 [Friedmanniomyces endolithicus]KAK0990018.1 hypothetical protein LTR54_012243 [Friedmanniomyces endolithicus]